MAGNPRVIFMTKIWRENHLDYSQVEELVNKIPFEHLNESIRIYKEYGLFELKAFVDGIKEV